MKKIVYPLIMLIGLSFFSMAKEEAEAATWVSNENQLVSALTKSSYDDIYFSNDIYLNQRIDIIGNKSVDLRGRNLVLGSGANNSGRVGKLYLNSPTNLTFELKNGVISGGDTRGLTAHNSPIGVISVDSRANSGLVTTVQDIKHTSNGGFYKGKNSDVVFKGEIELNNDHFNVRAKNMYFYGNPNNENDPENTDFYGYTSFNSSPGDRAQSNGGINLSFDGYGDISGMGQRVITINKNAKVKLKNDNNTPSVYRAYANNIGNFAVINVDGSLETEAIGTTLRTTASSQANSAGTYSGQAQINISPGAVFKTSSTATTNTRYGTIYTYPLDINVDNPEIFDIRFFGTGQFFYSYSGGVRGGSNLNIKNSNIAVWDKSRQGIKNPNDIWQNFLWMSINGFTNTGSPVATSSNRDLANRFTINNYSRISNDISLPIIIPDQEFMVNKQTVLKNNATSFYGATDYYLPNGSLIGRSDPNATVSFYLAGRTYRTLTDQNGDWGFYNLDLTRISGGSYG